MLPPINKPTFVYDYPIDEENHYLIEQTTNFLRIFDFQTGKEVGKFIAFDSLHYLVPTADGYYSTTKGTSGFLPSWNNDLVHFCSRCDEHFTSSCRSSKLRKKMEEDGNWNWHTSSEMEVMESAFYQVV